MKLRRDVFQAIADPTRRSILILLASQTMTAGAIAENFESARSTISKHIQILTDSGLLESTKDGREMHYQIKIDKIDEINIWLNQLLNIWEDRFDNLEKYLEKIQNNK